MNRDLFVDTAAWIALANRKDDHHTPAVEAYPRLLQSYRRLVTTNLVIAETYVNIRQYMGHVAAMTFLDSLAQSPRILRIYSDAALESEAQRILRQYADQDFSYTDAVSFASMRQRGIAEAFTFDKHFATAGFTMVP
jgi:predicted nucleic acid-binding protein